METDSGTLRITLLQTDPVWEDKGANYKAAEESIAAEAQKGALEIVLLPEMWATGFSMDTQKPGETVEGETVTCGELPRTHTVTLDKEVLQHIREQYPFLTDADAFELQ